MLAVVMILEGLIFMMLEAASPGERANGGMQAMDSFRVAWSLTYITAGVIGWIGAWRSKLPLVRGFARFLMMSLFVELVLSIVALSTALDQCKAMAEHNREMSNRGLKPGGPTYDDSLEDMESACIAFLRTLYIVQVVVKLSLGLYF